MENGSAVPVVTQERDIRVTTRDVAEYYKISVDQVRVLHREEIFVSSPTYTPGKRGEFRPLYSEVRALETHARVRSMQARHARVKTGDARGGTMAQLLKRLSDVEALQREQQRMLAALGVTVRYQDADHKPVDAVGERGGRPGDRCPGYKGQPSCGGTLLLRFSKPPDANGWFIGCTGYKHDGSGCLFCETIIRSAASAQAHPTPMPREEVLAVAIPHDPDQAAAPGEKSRWPAGDLPPH